MNDLKNRAFALIHCWSTGQVEPLADVVAPQFEEIDPPEAKAQGLAGLAAKIRLFHQNHGHVDVQVHQQIAEGDWVCSRWTLTATLRKPDDPSAEAPQRITQQGISWTQFDQGRIVRNHVHRDTVGYLMQRGYRWVPPDTAATTPQKAQA